MRFSRTRLSDHLLPAAFAILAWPPGIVSTEVAAFLEFPAFKGNLLPLPLQKHDESIAPSLSQGSAVLGILSVLWATPTPLPAGWNFVSLYPPVAAPHSTRKGLPCYPVWLPLRVALATPGARRSVLAVIVKTGVPAFP